MLINSVALINFITMCKTPVLVSLIMCHYFCCFSQKFSPASYIYSTISQSLYRMSHTIQYLDIFFVSQGSLFLVKYNFTSVKQYCFENKRRQFNSSIVAELVQCAEVARDMVCLISNKQFSSLSCSEISEILEFLCTNYKVTFNFLCSVSLVM